MELIDKKKLLDEFTPYLDLSSKDQRVSYQGIMTDVIWKISEQPIVDDRYLNQAPNDNNNYLEEAIQAFDILRNRNQTITVAESCSGGLLADAFIQFDGASSVFKQGYLTYSDAAKINMLNVKQETIRNHTAVSMMCAQEMAKGALAATEGADYAISITGYAGPGGGSDGTEPGVVWISVAGKNGSCVKKFMFKGSRNGVRRLAVKEALKLFISFAANE